MPFRIIGRRLRSLVLPLVGFWHLRQQLEQITARLAHIEAEAEQAAAEARRSESRLAKSLASLDAVTARLEIQSALPNEIRRRLAELGGELGVKTDIANLKLDQALHSLMTLTGPDRATPAPDLMAIRTAIAAEIDRLDGYMVHHAAELRTAIASRANMPVPIGQGIEMLIPCGGFDYVVPTAETNLLISVLRGVFTELEPGTRAVLRTLAKPGAVVIDAGANIGLHALPLAAAIGEAGHIHCFEPLPHIAATLARSMRVNGFGGRATVHNAALADGPGEARFNQAAHAPDSSLYTLPDTLDAHAIPVRLASLDDSFPPGTRIDLVKMDVEGAEPRVWRGMRRVLADNLRLAIVMEWSGSHFRRSGEDPAAFLATIRSDGFAMRLIEDAPIPGQLAEPLDDAAALEGRNVLLTRGI